MHFAPDTEETLEFAVALANTAPTSSRSGSDELASVERLAGLLARYRYSGRVDGDDAELQDVRDTRERLRRVWTLPRDDCAAAVNGMLRHARALPFLQRHDGMDWHLHATDPDAPLAERMRVEVCLALVDVIRSDENGRLRVCEADDCTGLLIDLSRNGSKRFCSIRCGNRVNMIAFRERAGAAGPG